MEREHTLQWLDRASDDLTSQALPQIQNAWDAHQYSQALRLCEHLITRANELQQHDSQGLGACYLGETYRLMGTHHYQDAVEAFGRARVLFSLGGSPASNRNKGVAYWSLAMVLEQISGHWNDALRFYQAALDTVHSELDEIQSQSAPPRANRARLVGELSRIQQLITEDQENLLRQQAMGDPKIIGLMRQLAAAEHRFQEAEERVRKMVERVEKAAVVATQATQHAYYAARAAQAVQTASDSASRQALRSARHVDQAVKLMEQSTERLQTAVERIEAAAYQATTTSQDFSSGQASTGQPRHRKKEA